MQPLSILSEKLQTALMPIHCLSEQQLVQYAEQRMPEVELHLVEQHLVDCPLCSTAVQMLQHAADKRPALQSIAQNVRKYLQTQYFPAPAEKPATLQRSKWADKERKRETVSQYVWVMVFVGVGVGGALWLNSHREMPLPARAAAVPQLPASPARTALELTSPGVATFTPPAKRQLLHQTVYTTEQPTGNTVKEPAKKTMAAIPLSNDSAGQKTPAPPSNAPAARAPATGSSVASKTKSEYSDAAAPVTYAPHQQPVQPSGLPDKHNDTEAVRPLHPEHLTVTSATDRERDERQYTAAKKLMQQGNWDEALQQLKDLSQEPGNRFYEMALYQSALCYKALGKKGRSRKALKTIVRENGQMKAQAEQELSSF